MEKIKVLLSTSTYPRVRKKVLKKKGFEHISGTFPDGVWMYRPSMNKMIKSESNNVVMLRSEGIITKTKLEYLVLVPIGQWK